MVFIATATSVTSTSALWRWRVPVLFFLYCAILYCTNQSPAYAQTASLEQQLRAHIAREIEHFASVMGFQPTRYDIDIFVPRGVESQPACDALSISRRQSTEPPWGRTTYSVSCSSPVNWQSRVTARTSVWADVVVARRVLDRSETLSLDMLALSNQDVTQIRAGPEFNPALLQGMRVNRRIAAGQPVLRQQLVIEYPVTAGGQVTLSISTSGFEASVRGEALDNGHIGDRVRVRNLSSDVIVDGIVRGENLVESMANTTRRY
jgi:flagellar basal body P-ring formation protein FlgA